MGDSTAPGVFTTVTEDGSVRLPAELRQALGIQPGDHVRVHADPQLRTLTVTAGVDIRTLFGFIKPAVQGVRVEDMDPGSGSPPYQDQVVPDEE